MGVFPPGKNMTVTVALILRTVNDFQQNEVDVNELFKLIFSDQGFPVATGNRHWM